AMAKGHMGAGQAPTCRPPCGPASTDPAETKSPEGIRALELPLVLPWRLVRALRCLTPQLSWALARPPRRGRDHRMARRLGVAVAGGLVGRAQGPQPRRPQQDPRTDAAQAGLPPYLRESARPKHTEAHAEGVCFSDRIACWVSASARASAA